MASSGEALVPASSSDKRRLLSSLPGKFLAAAAAFFDRIGCDTFQAVVVRSVASDGEDLRQPSLPNSA